jgi:hypothetical protein
LIGHAGDLSAEITLIIELDGDPLFRVDPLSNGSRLLFVVPASTLDHRTPYAAR